MVWTWVCKFVLLASRLADGPHMIRVTSLNQFSFLALCVYMKHTSSATSGSALVPVRMS